MSLCHHRHTFVLQTAAPNSHVRGFTKVNIAIWRSPCYWHREGGASGRDLFCILSGSQIDNGPPGPGCPPQRQGVQKLAESSTVSASTQGGSASLHQPPHERFPQRPAPTEQPAQETVSDFMQTQRQHGQRSLLSVWAEPGLFVLWLTVAFRHRRNITTQLK